MNIDVTVKRVQSPSRQNTICVHLVVQSSTFSPITNSRDLEVVVHTRSSVQI